MKVSVHELAKYQIRDVQEIAEPIAHQTKDIDNITNLCYLKIRRENKLYCVYYNHFLLQNFKRYEDAQEFIDKHCYDSVGELLESRFEYSIK